MQLPKEGSSVSVLRQFTAYTVRRLRTAKLTTEAQDCVAILRALRDAAGRVEDAEEPYVEALADRDAVDETADAAAEEASRVVAARQPDGKAKAPWNIIFKQGVTYYLAAPNQEQVKRYTELADKLDANLPAGDAVRASVVPRIRGAMEQWGGTEKALMAAVNTVVQRRVERDVAEAAWRQHMDRLYSALRRDLGKEAAERFFRRSTRTVAAVETPATDTAEG
jgi:hypothetical protein